MTAFQDQSTIRRNRQKYGHAPPRQSGQSEGASDEIKPGQPALPFVALIGVLIFEYLGVDGPHLLPQLGALKIPLLTSLVLTIYLINVHGVSKLWDAWAFRLLVVFTLLTASALIHGLIQSYAIDPLKQQIGYMALVFSGAFLITSEDRARKLSWVLVAIHLVIIALNWSKFGGVRSGGFSAGFFLGDGNDLAWSLTIVGPLALFLVFGSKSKFGRVASVLAFLVLMFGIVGTQSRGATLAVIASLLYLWMRFVKRKLAGVVVGGLLIVAVGMFAPAGYLERVESISNYETDSSATNRIRAWSRATEMAIDNPVFGVGAGSFNSAYGRSYRRVEDGDTARWISTHSVLFKVLAEYGFLGTAVFVAMIISLFRTNERTTRRVAQANSTEAKWLVSWTIMLNAALVAYAVAGLFLTGVDYPHRFLLLGLGIGASLMASNLDVASDAGASARTARRQRVETEREGR